MDINGIRRKNLRKFIEKMKSQADLADKLEMDPSYLSQIAGINPSKNIGTRVARDIEKKLGLSDGWMDRDHSGESTDLALGEGSPGSGAPPSIPVYAITAGMGRGKFPDSEQVLKIVVFDPATLRDMNLSGSSHGIVAVYADGESMLPTIPPKSLVFVDRNQRDLRDGVYLVRLEDMIYVKRLQRLPNHKVKVISDNPIYEPFDVDLKNGDDFEILGKVLRGWIERTF